MGGAGANAKRATPPSPPPAARIHRRLPSASPSHLTTPHSAAQSRRHTQFPGLDRPPSSTRQAQPRGPQFAVNSFFFSSLSGAALRAAATQTHIQLNVPSAQLNRPCISHIVTTKSHPQKSSRVVIVGVAQSVLGRLVLVDERDELIHLGAGHVGHLGLVAVELGVADGGCNVRECPRKKTLLTIPNMKQDRGETGGGGSVVQVLLPACLSSLSSLLPSSPPPSPLPPAPPLPPPKPRNWNELPLPPHHPPSPPHVEGGRHLDGQLHAQLLVGLVAVDLGGGSV